ncbi:MAG: hypothetical protein HKO65_12140 [Gemmatimonadetes bacterium]|nr:hypothetical protein [Gemmatimonadota bacterium]
MQPDRVFLIKNSGFTLVELLILLTLLGLGVGLLIPAARVQRDRFAVLGAREEVAGLLHRARVEAVARGGAALSLVAGSSSVAIVAEEDTVARTELHEGYGVAMALSGNRQEASLFFGPLGLGWVASQTIRFRRGAAEAKLIVSSLGRIVRE